MNFRLVYFTPRHLKSTTKRRFGEIRRFVPFQPFLANGIIRTAPLEKSKFSPTVPKPTSSTQTTTPKTTGGGGGSAGSPPETLTVGPKPTPPPTPPLTVLVSAAVETTGIKSNGMQEDGGGVISSHLTSSHLISSHLYYRLRQLLHTICQT